MFAFPKQEVWETDQEDWIPSSPRVQTNAGGHRAVVSDWKILLPAPHESRRPLLLNPEQETWFGLNHFGCAMPLSLF